MAVEVPCIYEIKGYHCIKHFGQAGRAKVVDAVVPLLCIAGSLVPCICFLMILLSFKLANNYLESVMVVMVAR